MKTNWILGALLLAAPLFGEPAAPQAEPAMQDGKLRWFTLAESVGVVRQTLGQPAMTAESGTNWTAWQYRLADDVAHEDYTHQLLFDRVSGELACITRNYEDERDVNAFFPAGETVVHYYPDARAPQMALRVRRLEGGLVLAALGASGRTSQLVLLRGKMLGVLYPWIQSVGINQ